MTSINADIVGVEEDELDHDMLDVDFLSSQSTTSSRQSAERPVLTHANKEVLKYIDSTFENIMSALARELPPEVVLKHTGYPQRATQENSSHGGYEVGNTAEKFAPAHTRGRSITYSWSGKREGEARRFGTFSNSLSQGQRSASLSAICPYQLKTLCASTQGECLILSSLPASHPR